MTVLKDAARRGIRTFLQSFLLVFTSLVTPIANGVVQAVTDGNAATIDFGAIQSAGIAAAAAGGIALLSFAQNELEDRGVIKTRLKDPATEAAEAKTLS